MQKSFIPLSSFSNPKNYRIALNVSRETLAGKDPREMAQYSGCPFNDHTKQFSVNLLNHPFTISFPEGKVQFQGTALEPYFVLQIVMLNYLARADGTPLTYEYVPYRALDGGMVFADTFYKTAVQPLVHVFGTAPENLYHAAAPFGGVPYPQGAGTNVMLYLFPRFPLLYKVWPGDNEFPAQANILFDSSANHYLHTEDVAACDVVTRLLTKQII